MGETLEINMKISHNQQDEVLSTQRTQGLVKDASSNFDAISKLAFSFDNLKPHFFDLTNSYLKIIFHQQICPHNNQTDAQVSTCQLQHERRGRHVWG